ncbi:MAG: hypothetical protein ACRDPH_09585 [Marmoricola sp.]
MKVLKLLAGATVSATLLASPLATTASAQRPPDPAVPAPTKVHLSRAATRGFTHPPAARKAGYGLLKDAKGIACIAMPPMGAMGVHYVNGDLVDPKVRLRHPEGLVYRFTRNGHLRLAALEYVVLKQDWTAAHGAGARRPHLFGHRFNFTPAGNRYGLPAFYSLHAWLWYHNPAGRFGMWNPRVHCPAGI